MATQTAASRLRDNVLKVPGTVLLISAGHPDKVVRFNRLPEIVQKYREQKEAERGEKFPTVHTALNLDIGPDSECWRNAMREAGSMARRDKPMPSPIEVAQDCKSEWAIDNEDVPVIELSLIQTSTAIKEPSAQEVMDKRTRAYKDSLLKNS